MIYDAAKAEADRRFKKPSAYKSGFIVRLYKEMGGKYSGVKPKKKGLTRWFKEKWTNQSGLTGYRSKSDVYRPNIRVSKETPKTFSELTEKELKKAQKEKAKTGRKKRF